jgi:hypothetical protein
MAITFNADTTNGAVITSDTSGEIELQANGVTKAKVTANGLQDANGNSLRGGSYRNLIINGDMKIAQRGTSASGLTNGSTGYHTVDRFQFVESGSPTSAWTMSQDTDVPTGQGFANSLKMDCTTAQASLGTGDTLYLFHKIEGQNLQYLKFGTSSAESLTLSFWVKSNKTGTYIAELYQTDATRAVSYAYTVSSANTWEKKTITYVGDTSGQIDNDNDTGLQIAFWLATGTDRSSGTLATSWASVNNPDRGVGQVNLADSTSNYINITGLQLEIGSGASNFEFLPYDVQLQKCQRYYVKQTGIAIGDRFAIGMGDTAPNINTIFALPTNMRATPSTSYDLINLRNGSTDETISSTYSIRLFNNIVNLIFGVSTTATIGAVYMVRGTASSGSYIDFSAEL